MKATAINHTAALAVQSRYAATPLRALNPRTLTVDIVLPVFNEAHILEESVRTLCTYMDDNLPYRYRIIIADNGSTDGTRRVAAMLACAVISAGAAPIAYSISTVMAAHSGSIPTAEPNASAMNNTNNEAASAEAALVKFLLANQQGAMWIAAVDSANTSAPIQLSTKQPVMAIGGFNGSDSALTLQSFKRLVATGKVRYYVVDSRSRGGGPGGNSDIAQWAASSGVKIEYGGTQYAVYDLKNAAL